MKQIASPGWMHETSAQAWCTGMTQRDGMGTEAGGGFRWGTHVNPWLIHVNVWQKLQYCKVISLQLIKINGKKIKEQKILMLPPAQQKKKHLELQKQRVRGVLRYHLDQSLFNPEISFLLLSTPGK